LKSVTGVSGVLKIHIMRGVKTNIKRREKKKIGLIGKRRVRDSHMNKAIRIIAKGIAFGE